MTMHPRYITQIEGPNPGPVRDLYAAAVPGRLGRLRLVEELGRGGMGVIYRAEDLGLRSERAVKVMHPHLAADPVAKERFVREARAAAAIDHPNVVPVYEVGEADGLLYLVMPLLRGKTLADWSRGRPPQHPVRWLRVGVAVADGLAAAHAAGLVHRDVKPSNIWLEAGTQPGRFRGARLLDFGLARPAGDPSHLTDTGEVLGTLGYMAPEQVDGRPVDARTDLFSLGCVLYELATGTRPFAGATKFEVARRTVTDRPAPPAEVNPAVPVGLSAFILELLAKKPDARPPTAGVVRDTLRDIDAALRERSDLALNGSSLSVTGLRRPGRRRGRAWAATVVAMLAAAATVGWLAFRP